MVFVNYCQPKGYAKCVVPFCVMIEKALCFRSFCIVICIILCDEMGHFTR